MLTFRDHWETDADGNQFVFTVEMQRRLSQAGLPVEVAYLDQLETAPPKPKPAPEPQPPREPKQEAQRQDVEEPESIQIDPMTGKYIGRVKWYNARKGYGFLLRGAGEEIFFHRSSTVGEATELDEGQWILYDVEETAKGPEATDIEPYEPQE